MAAPTIQVLESGERNHVIHVVGVADATATPGTVILDLSALAANSKGQAVTSVSLIEIQYETDGLVALAWDATAQVTFLQLAAGQDTKDYRRTGGLQNNAGAGITGDIRANPLGAAKNYSMTLWLKKKYG